MKQKNATLNRIVLLVVLLLFAGMIKPAFAQVPAAMEKEMDNINAAIYEAMKVIDTKSEADALRQLAVMKPKIEKQVEAFAAKWEGTELSEEDEIALGQKMLEKQLYKDIYALMGKPSFISKIEGNPELKKEFILLNSFLKEEEEEESTTTIPVSGSSVLSFTVIGAVPYSGNYSVKGNSEQAFAHIDENNLFAIDISSTLNEGEFQFIILAEEAKTGEHKWSMESQIIIQSWDENQNEVIQLSNYYKDGSITFDKIEGVGGMVSGSFSGKFFDDTQSTEDPVQVHGKFSVIRISGSY